ncbi:MAG: 50S ribosomal protein L23 [Thermodesulfovibrionales bacterium]
MKDLHDLILGPLISEKSTRMKENREVVFKVVPKANKIEIKKAVEELFKVRVESVRTANFQGKLKRWGRFEGRRRDWKKAIVKLKEGEKMIDFTEV